MPLKAAPEYFEPIHLPQHFGQSCFSVLNRDHRQLPPPNFARSVSVSGEVIDESDGIEIVRHPTPFTSHANYINLPFNPDRAEINSFVDLDITTANLRRTDFTSQDFSGAHQKLAYAYGLSDMLGGHGPSIDVSYSLFRSARFHRTEFCHVVGEYTCFCKADLDHADFDSALLTAACFQESRIIHSGLHSGVISHSNFSRADLTDSSFAGTNLTGTCFSEAKFSGETSFVGADLTRTCFQNTNLRRLLKDGEFLFPKQEVSGADFRVIQTIAGARLPARVRTDLAGRGAIVDLPSSEDWPEEAFFEGYLDRSDEERQAPLGVQLEIGFEIGADGIERSFADKSEGR